MYVQEGDRSGVGRGAAVCFVVSPVEMEGSLWQFGKFHCFLYEGGGEDLDGD